MPRLDPEKVAIGRRIRQARVAAGLSQHQLARRLDITAGAVGQWELGITIPKAQTLNELPAILGVSHEFLVGQVGQQHAIATSGRDEETILRLVRKLTLEEQKMLIRQLNGLVGRG